MRSWLSMQLQNLMICECRRKHWKIKLQKANEEFGLMKQQYEVELQELSSQTVLKSNHVEKISDDLKGKCAEVENFKKQEEEIRKAFSVDMKRLDDEIKRLKTKSSFSQTGLQKEGKQTRNQSKKKVSSRDSTIVQTSSCDLVKEVVSEKLNLNEQDRCAEEPNAKDHDLQLSKMSSKAGAFKQYGVDKEPTKRDETRTLKGWREATCPTTDNGELADVLSKMAILKERNKCMEAELKEMQERYTEVSLKFAEVEGERQQLVMTVRNLKNTKK